MSKDSLFHLLIKVCRAHYKSTHQQLEKIGLYRGQPPLLHLLWKREGRTQKNLSEELNIKPATIAKMVRRMEKEGFIEKKTDSEDRRRSRIFLTAKGRNIKKKVKEIEEEINSICLKNFTAGEEEQFKTYLRKMAGNLEIDLKNEAD